MPEARKRPCTICRRWFRPDARVGVRQRACDAPECQAGRRQKTQARWRNRNQRVRPGCDTANDTGRPRGAAGDDPFAGVLFAGDRGSAATTGQPGILSVPPPQTPTCRLGTIAPIPSPKRNPPPTPRAFGADDIAAYPRRNGRTPCGVDDDAGFSILFPEWVTSTEHYGVTSR